MEECRQACIGIRYYKKKKKWKRYNRNECNRSIGQEGAESSRTTADSCQREIKTGYHLEGWLSNVSQSISIIKMNDHVKSGDKQHN